VATREGRALITFPRHVASRPALDLVVALSLRSSGRRRPSRMRVRCLVSPGYQLKP